MVALVCLAAAGCEPAPRTTGPRDEPPAKATPASEPAAPAPSAETEDQLRSMIKAAESVARLNVGFTLSRRIGLAEAAARHWASERFGTDAQAVTVELLGTRSGFPAFAVSRGGGLGRLPVIVADDEVLVGPRGFARFVAEHEPGRDAVRWATAWLLLHEGVATEPLGHWSTPVSESPRFVDGETLRLIFTGDDGQLVEAEVAIADDGTATTRSRKIRRRR